MSYLVGIYFEISQPVSPVVEGIEEGATDPNVSETSLLVAALRARSSMCETSYFARRDVLAEYLAGEKALEQIENELALEDETKNILGGLAMRTLSIDDRIMEAKKDNVKQMVILGAGLDSRPYRLNLGGVKWFEVDVAEIIEYKEQAISKVPDTIPTTLQVESLSRVPLNLKYRLKDLVPSLEANGFDKTEPALFLMEGLIMYLSVNEVRSLFQALPVVRGSRVVATQVSFVARKGLTNPIFTTLMNFQDKVKIHKIANLWKSDHLVLWLGDAYKPWEVLRQINIAKDQLEQRNLTLPKTLFGKRAFTQTKTGEDVLDFIV